MGTERIVGVSKGYAKHFELRKVCVIGGSNVFGNVPWGCKAVRVKESLCYWGLECIWERSLGYAKHFELRKVGIIGGSNVFGKLPWGYAKQLGPEKTVIGIDCAKLFLVNKCLE